MIKDIAQGTILASYSDTHLAESHQGLVLEQLRRLPATWRQNAMAEVQQRVYETRSQPASHNRELMESYSVQRPGTDFFKELKKVVDEILEGLN